MAFRLIKANEATAARRRVYFDIRDGSDGITPITTISGGQPQISTNGGSFTNTGISTLTHIGVGRYYADITQAAVGSAGDVILTRFKSAVSAESPGDMAVVVAFDPYDAAAMGLTYLNAAVGSRSAPGDQMTLTAGAQTSLVAAIEAEIADDQTGAAIKQAIVDKLIENLPDLDDLTLAAIGNAARDAILDRVLSGNHDTAGSAGQLLQDINAKTTNLPAAPAAQEKIDTLHDTRLTETRAGNLDNLNATVSSRLASDSYTTPDNAGISSAATSAASAASSAASILTKLSGITVLANWLRAFFRSDAPDATALSEINSSGGTYDATTDSHQSLRDLAEADRYIDTSDSDQWKMVLIKKGSGDLDDGTVLLTQNLYDADGNPITAINAFVGKAVAP